MKRRYAVALGVLALSWWPASLDAQTTPKMARRSAFAAAQADPVQVVAQPAPRVIEAGQVEVGPMPSDKPKADKPAAHAVESVTVMCEQPCDSRCGLVAGVGLLLVHPHWDSNPAFISSFAPAGIAGGATRTVDEFDWDPEFAPLIWLGFQSDDGFGVRARYWGLRASAGGVNITNDLAGLLINTPLGQSFEVFPFTAPAGGIGSATVGDTLTAANDLDMDVWDLEMMQDLRAGRWSLVFAGGLRYAEIGQGYQATLFNPDFVRGQVARLSVDNYSNRFTGFGPTAAVEARRPLGYGLYLYGSSRISVLFGTSRHQAINVDQLIVGGVVTPTLIDINASREEPLPVVEVEVGGEWAAYLDNGTRLFLRGALVGQAWHGIGSASAAVANDVSDMGLYGLSFAIGVDR